MMLSINSSNSYHNSDCLLKKKEKRERERQTVPVDVEETPFVTWTAVLQLFV